MYLVVRQPLPATFQFAAFKLFMPKQNFSRVDGCQHKENSIESSLEVAKNPRDLFPFSRLHPPIRQEIQSRQQEVGKSSSGYWSEA